MTDVHVLGRHLAKPLNRRRRISVDLPEFAVRAVEWLVDEANGENGRDDGRDGEDVTFNDVIEWLVVTEVTAKRMALLEQAVPGFTAAMFVWLMEATYQPHDD